MNPSEVDQERLDELLAKLERIEDERFIYGSGIQPVCHVCRRSTMPKARCTADNCGLRPIG